ncbi:elongation factor P [Erythrobacter sp. SCSIO 43205]|uniref:elongation factor P n=1 Tax=Erythrobacter sp. SCSIO 43205 TaxID=2779361 RepID=UPI001CA9DF85|nr:elongation factor P [Erythrobacter sp. SCSIO 43205]UAB77021.1 elongation factor P [Erythrobacter sp. SCSIO 43205]
MRTSLIILLAIGAVVATAGPVLPKTAGTSMQSQPPGGGMLRTMPHGDYQCALPGDAGGDAYQAVPDEGFSISTASRYSSAAGDGTYILRGRSLTFTAGPKNGERFERVGDNQLRKLERDGKKGELLCTRLADRRQ